MPSVLLQLSFVQLDGILQSQVKCIAYQGVADGNLVQPRDLLFKVAEIMHVKIMPCVYAKSKFFGSVGGSKIRGNGAFFVCKILFCIPLRIQFNPVGSRCSGALHHFNNGINKYGYPDARVLKNPDHVR